MNTSYRKIDALLRGQDFSGSENDVDVVYRYAESIAMIEKCVVVVSDLKYGVSKIFYGEYANTLGLEGASVENSIWEREILSRMSPEMLEEKYLTELRFFNYLRHIPRGRRENYYLAAQLRMRGASGNVADVLHRMYYWYEGDSDVVRFGICIYGPIAFAIPSKSVAIDSLTGRWVELSPTSDYGILSAREKQVLSLVEKGFTSRAIADQLCISKNTVSRHRQEILAKLQAKNSTEACRRAKQMRIID